MMGPHASSLKTPCAPDELFGLHHPSSSEFFPRYDLLKHILYCHVICLRFCTRAFVFRSNNTRYSWRRHVVEHRSSRCYRLAPCYVCSWFLHPACCSYYREPPCWTRTIPKTPSRNYCALSTTCMWCFLRLWLLVHTHIHTLSVSFSAAAGGRRSMRTMVRRKQYKNIFLMSSSDDDQMHY